MVTETFSRAWKKFPNALVTEPPGALNGSKSASLNLIAGSVWFVVGKDGVVRVALKEDSKASREEAV